MTISRSKIILKASGISLILSASTCHNVRRAFALISTSRILIEVICYFIAFEKKVRITLKGNSVEKIVSCLQRMQSGYRGLGNNKHKARVRGSDFF